MKTSKIILGLFILVTLTAINSLADEFTFTTTLNNTSGYRGYMDLAGLTNNPSAIIVATLLGNTTTINNHPIGVYYNQLSAGKYEWSIFNLDQAAMSPNLNYKVQYFTQPGSDQFVHLVPAQTASLFKTYIDNPVLNNKPAVLVQIMPVWAPSVRVALYNRYQTAVVYDPAVGKWYITNVGGEAFETPSAFNVIVTAPLPIIKSPIADKTLHTTPKTRVKP
jgi:hypothetical protein